MSRFRSFFPGDAFGRRGPDGILTLDRRAADLLNGIRDGLRAAGLLGATAPVTVSDGPTGRQVSFETAPRVWGLLGPTNTFAEQQWVEGVGWQPRPGGMTGKAYESSGAAGVSGVAPLEYEPLSNDWRFTWQGDSTGCNPVCLAVKCNSANALPGVTINLYQGSGTTGPLAGSCVTTGRVTAVTITHGGSGYDPANVPTVGFTGGGGTGAAGVVNLIGGAITAFVLSSGGSGYTNPTVTIPTAPGPGGSAARGVAIGKVTGLALFSGGTGYVDGSYTDGTFSGGGGSGATFSYTVSGGSIVAASLAITNAGANFTSAPLPVFHGGGTGTGAAGGASLTLTSITGGGGSLYTSPPTVSIADPTGSGASATANLSAISVGSVTMTNTGSGYTSNPTVAFTATTGSGATGTAGVSWGCCMPYPGAGTYTVQTSFGVHPTITFGLTCRGAYPSNLAPYIAANPDCSDANALMPSTLHLSDSIFGNTTLTWSPSLQAWVGSSPPMTQNGFTGTDCSTIGPVTFVISYTLFCNGGVFILETAWPSRPNGLCCVGVGGGGAFTTSPGNVSGNLCTPGFFAAPVMTCAANTGTFPPSCTAYVPYASPGGTITITA